MQSKTKTSDGKPVLKYQHDALLGAVERRFMERIDSETNALVNGRCADITDYKVRVAVRQAWTHAIEELGAAVTTYLDEDDDDD